MSKGEELFGTIYQKGEVVFRQGELGDTMYIIQSGAVEVSQVRGDQKFVLALLGRGDFFGEMALIDKYPRSATVACIRRSRLLPLTRSSLLERARYDPGVVFHLLKSLSQRIEKTNNLLRSMVQGDETLLSLLEISRGQCAVEPQPDIVSKVEKEILPFKKSQIPQELESVTMENQLQPQALHFCKDQGECIWFEPGETIFRQEDHGDTMYIILEGEVEISKESESDRYLIARLCPGEFFGEMTIITDQPRIATASATKRTQLLPIKKNEFFEKVKAEPELALYILQVLIMRLRGMLSFMGSPEKSSSKVLCNIPPLLQKKGLIRTAIISLSTCGGCPAVFLEDQEELLRLLEKVHISYCPMLIDELEIGEVEVAIVDGAVRVKEDEEKLLEIRKKSRYLVAWGTCATFGGIPAFANQYELEELIEESYGQTQDPFAYYLSGAHGISKTAYQESELKMLRRVGKLNDFVRVDYYLPGCPPKISILSQLVSELIGEGQILKPRPIVCSECNRKALKTPLVESVCVFPSPEWKSDHCFVSLGALCMGFVTKGGCGAVCPQGGLPCWGCRGPSVAAFKKLDEGNSFEEIILNSLVIRTQQSEENIKPLLKIARRQTNSSLNFKQNFVSDRSRIR
jgi:F420-non-reducing hydrogenase small subunit